MHLFSMHSTLIGRTKELFICFPTSLRITTSSSSVKVKLTISKWKVASEFKSGAVNFYYMKNSPFTVSALCLCVQANRNHTVKVSVCGANTFTCQRFSHVWKFPRSVSQFDTEQREVLLPFVVCHIEKKEEGTFSTGFFCFNALSVYSEQVVVQIRKTSTKSEGVTVSLCYWWCLD